MLGKFANPIAWSLWLLPLACWVAALSLRFTYGLAPLGSAAEYRAGAFETAYQVFVAATFLAIPTFGLLVATRRPASYFGWLFLLAGLFVALPVVLHAYVQAALYEAGGVLMDTAFSAAWFANWIGLLAFGLLAPLLVLFPTGRAPSRRWHGVIWFAGATTVAGIVSTAFKPGPLPGFVAPAIENPLAIAGAETFFAVVQQVGLVCLAIGTLAAASSLVVRLHSAGKEERQQIKWVAFGAAMYALGLAINVLSPPAWRPLTGLVYLVALNCWVATIGIAILKHRLYDIDPLINRTLVYGALAVGITVAYVAGVAGIGALIGRRGEPGADLLLSLVVTAFVAIVFQPLRARVERLANRLVYGHRASPYEVLAEFSRELARAPSLDEVLPRMAEAAARGVGARRARARVYVPGGRDQAVSWPSGCTGETFDRTAFVLHQGTPLIVDDQHPVHNPSVAGGASKRKGASTTNRLVPAPADCGMRTLYLIAPREDSEYIKAPRRPPMHTFLYPLLALAAALTPVLPLAAQSDTSARIDAYVRTRLPDLRTPGLSIVVVEGDQVIFSRGYGFADRDSATPMTEDTPVAVGSTNKGMTALAMMQLVEQGLVDLNTPITAYLPDFAMDDERAVGITVRQLLSHTSGIPAGTASDGFQDDQALERRVASLGGVKLQRAPGAGYEYSLDGYSVAGLIVQRVSGTPYEDYLAEHVFGPLRMAHTTFDLARDAELGFATNYAKSRGIVSAGPSSLSRGGNPAGGVLTTARDVGHYFVALLNGGVFDGTPIVAADAIDQMWTPDPASGAEQYGFGWGEMPAPGLRLLSHAGDVGAPGVYGSSGSQFILAPERRLAVGVLANLSSFEKAEIAQDALTIALGGVPAARPVPPDWRHPTFAPDRAVWTDYVGDYQSSQPLRIYRDGDKLLGSGPGFGIEFVAMSDTDFVMLSTIGALDEQPAEFQRQPDGSMVILFHGQTLGVKR